MNTENIVKLVLVALIVVGMQLVGNAVGFDFIAAAAAAIR